MMQISQKDQQIEQLEATAKNSKEELNQLRKNLIDLKKEGDTRAAEKTAIQKKLKDAESENAELRSKCDQADRKIEEIEKEKEEKGEPE